MPREPEGGYEVGYGRPPRHTQFAKGRSGNPLGRPKGSRNLNTLVEEALDETVLVNENGRRRKITKRQAIATQLANKSAAGDLRAIKIILDQNRLTEDRQGALVSKPGDALTAPDAAIIARYLARQSTGGAHAE